MGWYLGLGPDALHGCFLFHDRFDLHRRAFHRLHDRCDEEIQQLSLKSVSKDPAVRTEVNLNLSGGNQISSVRGFLSAGDILFEGSIRKSVFVYDFNDAEVVYYKAQHDDHRVSCIEIEAKQATSVEAAKAIINSYEHEIGLDTSRREKSTLFDLLLRKHLPQ